ncbi:MAG: glycerophosphodiester phosphodiesterase family protein, partial [Planctomycetota bacterium]
VSVLEGVISDQLRGKEKLIGANLEAINLGRDYAQEHFDCPLPISVRTASNTDGKIMVSGNDAAGLGAIYAGASVCAWYPITPSTSLAEAFERYAKRLRKDADGRANYAIVQAEDELAAIGIAIGAGCFQLDEVRSLVATGGVRHGLRGCTIPTFSEFLGLVRHLETSGLRSRMGIVPELKAPSFHRAEGRPQEEVYVQALREVGYDREEAPCITQCFEPDALVRLRASGVDSPLLELLGGDVPDAVQLKACAERAAAVGPSRSMIEATGGQLVKDAHALGLAVIPYTFKDDEDATRRFFTEYGVDALFSDFPDVALRARR